jgi:hypothetical protein
MLDRIYHYFEYFLQSYRVRSDGAEVLEDARVELPLVGAGSDTR